MNLHLTIDELTPMTFSCPYNLFDQPSFKEPRHTATRSWVPCASRPAPLLSGMGVDKSRHTRSDAFRHSSIGALDNSSHGDGLDSLMFLSIGSFVIAFSYFPACLFFSSTAFGQNGHMAD